jgi:hypothetical protein
VTAATPAASPAASPAAASKSDYDWNTLANQAISATPNKMLKVKQLQSRILGKIVAASNNSGQKTQGLGQLVKKAIPGDLSLDSSAGFVITGNEVRNLFTAHIIAMHAVFSSHTRVCLCLHSKHCHW